jgi:hypothetical protein
VPTTTHSNQKAIVLGELNGRDDIGHAGAPPDEGWETSNRPVPNPASILVAGVLRAEQLAPETVLQSRDVQCSHRGKFRSARHSYHSSLLHAPHQSGCTHCSEGCAVNATSENTSCT